MVRETWVQTQVASYQRLKIKNMVLDTSFLTLSNIRYVSRIKWSNPGKGVVLSPTSQSSIYWKGSLLVALDYSRQLYFILESWSEFFTNGLGDQGSIADRVIPKTQKWYLMLPCLTNSIIWYISRVSGAIQGKELCLPQVAIEKGTFRSPSTMVSQYIYI